MLFHACIASLSLLFIISTSAVDLPTTLQLDDGGPDGADPGPLPRMKVHCTPNTTVESLSMYSCNNAWHKIVRSVTPVIYSQRPGTGKAGDVSLPVRYLSGESSQRCSAKVQVRDQGSY